MPYRALNSEYKLGAFSVILIQNDSAIHEFHYLLADV